MSQSQHYYNPQVGDLVRIIEGTHDPSMPEDRIGLIVEILQQEPGDAPRSHDTFMVKFGTRTLKFHKMWLEKVS